MGHHPLAWPPSDDPLYRDNKRVAVDDLAVNVISAMGVIAWIELRITREIREAVRRLEHDHTDNGGRRRARRFEEDRKQ